MNFVRFKIILGYLGFLPFAFFTILPMIFGEVLAIWSLQILSIYGGIILSFLAGMTWGWPKKESSNFNLLIGILFSLLGFLIILLAKNFLIYSMILNFFLFPVFLISFDRFLFIRMQFFVELCNIFVGTTLNRAG